VEATMPIDVNGRDIARHGDRLACGHRLIASSDLIVGSSSQDGDPVPSGAPATQHVVVPRASVAPARAGQSFHLPMRLCDVHGRPHADLRYVRCVPTSPRSEGKTAAQGHTCADPQPAAEATATAFAAPSMEQTP
jgi:hypothetical protein